MKQVKFIDAWHEIAKLRKIYFWLKMNSFMYMDLSDCNIYNIHSIIAFCLSLISGKHFSQQTIENKYMLL